MDSKKFLQLVEEKKKRVLQKTQARLEWEQKLEAAAKDRYDAKAKEREEQVARKKHKKRLSSDSFDEDLKNAKRNRKGKSLGFISDSSYESSEEKGNQRRRRNIRASDSSYGFEGGNNYHRRHKKRKSSDSSDEDWKSGKRHKKRRTSSTSSDLSDEFEEGRNYGKRNTKRMLEWGFADIDSEIERRSFGKHRRRDGGSGSVIEPHEKKKHKGDLNGGHSHDCERRKRHHDNKRAKHSRKHHKGDNRDGGAAE